LVTVDEVVAIALSITTMKWTEHGAATGNKRLERFSSHSFLWTERFSSHSFLWTQNIAAA
jgi:hypothetical protein